MPVLPKKLQGDFQ
uniref:Uncharacterized protein n=1 Tax=Arundo donax TaxID=35708 RepID=A0A0A8Z3E9_ARUDO